MAFGLDFWQGWYTFLTIIAVLVMAHALWYGCSLEFVFGLGLGFTFVGLVTRAISTLSLSTLGWALALLAFWLVVSLVLDVERRVYKWTNGRPPNEQ